MWPEKLLPVYFFDMELGEQSLDDYIKTHYRSTTPALPQNSVIWSIMRQIASALAFMHASGLIHRDIKPANGPSMPQCLLTFPSDPVR
jgi:serine/threonine protein kinase